jgi:hypothetical protein
MIVPFIKSNASATALLFLLSLTGLPLSSHAQIRDRESIVQYTLQKPDEVKRGNTFQVSVVFSVQPEWYIYAPTGVNAAQGMIETQVVLLLPPGLSRLGKIRLPETTFKNGHEIYQGENIAMTQSIQAGPDLAPGVYEIKGKVIWQTCNSDICLPPVTREVAMAINIK